MEPGVQQAGPQRCRADGTGAWIDGTHPGPAGVLAAHTELGWRWDELGTGMGPFPSCGCPSPRCACTPAQAPSGAERRQPHAAYRDGPKGTHCAHVALPARPLAASLVTLGAMPPGHCQRLPCHLCAASRSPAGCQHPWGQHPARVGGRGTGVGTRMGEAPGIHCRALGARQRAPATRPHSPGPPFRSAGQPHPLSPACSLPSPPGPHTVCHTCHHGKGEISPRPSAPAPSH